MRRQYLYGMMDLWDRIQDKYSQDGLIALFRVAPTFLKNQVRFRVRAAFRMGLGRITGDEILQNPDVLSIARRSGSLWKYREDETICIEYPGDQRLHPDLREMLGTYESEAPFVCEAPATILVSSVPGADGNGGFVLEREADRPYHRALIDSLRSDPAEFKRLLFPKNHAEYVERFNGAFILSAYPPPSYYHWVLDYLPKIQAYEHYRSITDRCPPIVIPEEPEYWRVEALKHVGYDMDDCVFWQEGPKYVDRLVVPYHRNRTPKPGSFTPSIEDCRWLKRRIFRNLKRTDAEFSSRVYLSRRDANSRRVVNESEVERTLDEFGFESYALGEMSFGEGVQLFEQADVIVGPHGAGFANLLFSDDVKFLEFFPEDDVRGGFLCLVCQLGHSYNHQIGERVGNDIYVETTELEYNLRKMGL